MADQLTTGWSDLLYEQRAELQKLYPKKSVLLSELKREKSREFISGSQIRVPLLLTVLQGAQGIAEAGTVTDAQNDETAQAHVDPAHQIIPVRISPELMKQSLDNAAAKALTTKSQRAFEAMARLHNEMLHVDSNGLLANVTSNTGSAGLVIPVTNGNPRQLYRNRIVDILTRSNGANPGNGVQRKITAVSRDTNGLVDEITVSTSAFGGDSGNVTFSANEGIYIQDTYGNALSSIRQAGATTGTFQDIDKAVVTEWQGVDGRDGDSTQVDPSLSIIDGGLLVMGERADNPDVDFFVGDPGVILKFGQLFYSAFRQEMPVKKLDTGFEGVAYKGTPMIGDYDHQPYALSGITKKDMTLYAYMGEPGPDWDDLTGSRMQRFARTRVVELWLVDDLQLGVHDCRGIVRWAALNRASA